MRNESTRIKELIGFTTTLSVLYIEDNEEARVQTLKMLKNFFSHLDTAVDGLDGLEKFRSFSDENNRFYDLVISDINMPRMDGITMSDYILKENPKQQIIMLSASGEKWTSPIKHHIHKPIELNSLIFTLEEAVFPLQELAHS